jgi:Bacterial archaeo-eukaryotic release factor family 3
MSEGNAWSGFTSEELAELSSVSAPPCLSLYQRTHRSYPDNQQDAIRFRNLVKDLRTSLERTYSALETEPLLAPFEDLASDASFWNHTLDGLAVLGAKGVFRAIRIPESVPELTVVADTFHTKPLRRFLQSRERFQVLALSLDKIRMFEGSRTGLDELELVPGVPRSIVEALGPELTEPHQTVASYGGVGGSSSRMHHSHGGKADEADTDAQRFFRAVDRAVWEHMSKPSRLPLVLAALPEHHHLFHQVSQNPQLVPEGVRVNPESLSLDELRTSAWQVMEPRYRERLARLRDEFERAFARATASDNLTQVAEASAAGRVATLFVDAGRQIPGRLDRSTGRVTTAKLEEPDIDDLLDDVAELVVEKGGVVWVVPAEEMPSRKGLAAIYRY